MKNPFTKENTEVATSKELVNRDELLELLSYVYGQPQRIRDDRYRELRAKYDEQVAATSSNG
jgi:hypothetical protein